MKMYAMSFSVRKSLDSIIRLLTILFVNNVFNSPLLLQGYMVSLFNRFDFFVVCSSILEYTLVKFEVGVKTVFVYFHIFAFLPWMNFVRLCHPWVSLLWGVSVFWEPSKSRSKWKLLKIDLQLPLLSSHRYWKAMGGLVKSLVDSIASIVALLVLLVLFIFIFALLGMQVPSLPRQLLWIFFSSSSVANLVRRLPAPLLTTSSKLASLSSRFRKSQYKIFLIYNLR